MAARVKAFEHGDDACHRCYTAAQTFAFPFVVFCRHRGRVVLVHAPDKWESWPLSQRELLELASARRAA